MEHTIVPYKFTEKKFWLQFWPNHRNSDPISMYCSLPFYPGPPTDRGALLPTLKICQSISTNVTEEHNTVVSLDLQLYINPLHPGVAFLKHQKTCCVAVSFVIKLQAGGLQLYQKRDCISKAAVCWYLVHHQIAA